MGRCRGTRAGQVASRKYYRWPQVAIPTKPPLIIARAAFPLPVLTCRPPHEGMLGCPESPVYLAGKGKRAEAEEVALKLWGPAGASQLGGAAEGGGRGERAAQLRGPPLGAL